VVAERRDLAPAFYAVARGRRGDWWTLLHPPYTLWHLSYVVIGGCLVAHLNWGVLAWTVIAFFLAVGLGAHAFDELHGHPLRTRISDSTLRMLAWSSLGAAALLGIVGVIGGRLILLPCIATGIFLVPGYNLEWFAGRIHTDVGFAVSWGGFPLAVGYLAQSASLADWRTVAAFVAGYAAVMSAYAQRRLSTPARELRRRTAEISGVITRADGSVEPLDRGVVLMPLEAALKALAWAIPLLATSLLLTHVP
jgi:hypothetical protein